MKCPKCGYDNLGGGTKCGKCGTSLLVKQKISCPKCATINPADSKKCKKCGYNFNTKRHLVLNIIISLLFVAVLFILLYYKKISWLKNISRGFRIFSIFIIIILVGGTLLFRRSDATDRNIAEVKVAKAPFNGLRVFSKICLTILGIVFIAIGVYFAVKYIK